MEFITTSLLQRKFYLNILQYKDGLKEMKVLIARSKLTSFHISKLSKKNLNIDALIIKRYIA